MLQYIMIKTCIKCKEQKEEDLFNWKIQGIRRNNTCKKCHSEYRKQHYQANKQKYIDKARNWERKNGGKPSKSARNHHLGPNVYKELKERYNGKCWCCKIEDAKVIDHDHSCCSGQYSCGKCVRGMLCGKCNTGIGMLGDDLNGIQKAIEYLSHKH